MPKNVAAWTDAGGQPQYISANRSGDYDANVTVTVRDRKGAHAEITMTKEQFALFVLQAAREV